MLVQIVDDNETNLVLLSQIVRRVADDLEIETFLDPVAALDACTARMPDMILVDYMMPDVDGHEFVRRVRAMPPSREVPIVMVTAAGERPVRQKALELGATDFLAKPVDPSEVKARLLNLLALRRSHLRLKDQNRWLADEVRKATKVIADREEELIVRLSKAAEFRDPETGAHIHRMAYYSKLIAVNLGLDEVTCDFILRAAPMHDVGKLGIPDGILLKPGRLDRHEFEVMQRHAAIGHDILCGSESALIRLGAEIALSHHEKWDGSGYPKKLAGEAIPLNGRIVAVADVFDALTSERPYKKAWTLEDARALLVDGRGSHFDPACVDAFLNSWDEVQVIRERFADPLPHDGLTGM
ncbi:MAG: response regulator [Magnetospirillum sp.]|nr:response regulator [Magnetospirillum sp.]